MSRCSKIKIPSYPYREKLDQLENDKKKIHKCGDIPKKTHGFMQKILGWTKKTPFYKFGQYLADSNPDLVLLAKIMTILIAGGLIYYLYSWIAQYQVPGFSTQDLVNNIQTMDASDLPMVQHIDVQNELDAVAFHRQFFDKAPYSLENIGTFDLVRGVLILPFLVFFIHYILPLCAVVYVAWFLYNYLHYITKASYGFITEVIIKYMTQFLVCKIASIIPFFKYKCPNLYQFLIEWKREYVDKPVYIEKIKYFKFYYEQKRKLYDIPKIKYIDQNIEKSKINYDYTTKFTTRCKDIFYKKVLNADDTIKNNKYITRSSSFINNKYNKYKNSDKNNKPKTSSNTKTNKLIDICDKIDSFYSISNIIMGIILFIISIAVISVFVYYSITGRPISIYEAIMPFYRTTELTSKLQLMKTGYNWIAIIGIMFILIGSLSKAFTLMDQDN